MASQTFLPRNDFATFSSANSSKSTVVRLFIPASAFTKVPETSFPKATVS